MLITVVLDVVDRQNERLINPTRFADKTAIRLYCFGLQPIIVGESSFAALFRIGFFPIGIAFIDSLFIEAIIFPIVLPKGLPGFIFLALVTRGNAFLAFPPIPILCGTDTIELVEWLFLTAHPTFHEFLMIHHVL